MPQISICSSPETEPPEPLETRALVVRRIFDEGKETPFFNDDASVQNQTGAKPLPPTGTTRMLSVPPTITGRALAD
jgi:hypothetical protein